MLDVLYNTVAVAGEGLGFKGVAVVGEGLGGLLWAVMGSRRRYARDAVALRLGLDTGRARDIARASFGQSCRSFAEMLLNRRVDWRFVRERLDVQDPDLWRAMAQDPAPGVAATAHLGAWELLVGLLQIHFSDRPKQVVVRRPHDMALNRVMMLRRTRPGVEIVEHRNAAPRVLRALRGHGMTAFLVDHNCTRNEALFLPFLGLPAAVNIGPALMAVRAKAKVWPIFLTREPGGRYALRQEPPLDTRSLEGTINERVAAVAEFYTRAVERQVRARPEQWFWMHHRWKTRPEPTP